MHITLKNKQGKGSIKNVFWIIIKSYWGNETQNTHFILIYVIQVRLSETSTAISIFFSFCGCIFNRYTCQNREHAKTFDCVDHNKLWKILKEMGIPDHLTCLLINLYAGQEATVRTGHGKTDWFQIGNGVHQGCILSPC